MAEPTKSPIARLSREEVATAISEMRGFYWRLYDERRAAEAACVCSCLKFLGSGVWPKPEGEAK